MYRLESILKGVGITILGIGLGIFVLLVIALCIVAFPVGWIFLGLLINSMVDHRHPGNISDPVPPPKKLYVPEEWSNPRF